jgi:hypothetical protein
MQWYLDGFHLNNGYHFFAPEPPAGFLIQYELVDSRGNKTVAKFPDKKEHRPRLLYHRYFMLADQADFPSPDEKVNKEWTRRYLEAYGQELLRKHDGERIRIQRVVHDVLMPPMMRRPEDRNKKLDDPSTYRVELEVVQTRRDVELDDKKGANQSNPQNRIGSAGWTPGGRR